MSAWVYIMVSRKNGTLYTGVTTDLLQRVYEHKNDLTPGFTSKYGVKRLAWYKNYDNIVEAITAEKHIKKWRRKWKIQLIEKENPDWQDLYDDLL